MKGETGHPPPPPPPPPRSFLFRPQLPRLVLCIWTLSSLLEKRRDSESLLSSSPSSSSFCPSSGLCALSAGFAERARSTCFASSYCFLYDKWARAPLLSCPPPTASYTGSFRGIRPSSRSLDSYAKHPSQIPPELEPISYLRATG